MNKVIHGLILASFGFGCWCLWGVLRLTANLVEATGNPPMFTQFCVNLRPTLLAPPALAAIYCLCVWVNTSARPHSDWVGFFAVTMTLLMLLLIVTFIAAWLPLVKFIELQFP